MEIPVNWVTRKKHAGFTPWETLVEKGVRWTALSCEKRGTQEVLLLRLLPEKKQDELGKGKVILPLGGKISIRVLHGPKKKKKNGDRKRYRLTQRGENWNHNLSKTKGKTE